MLLRSKSYDERYLSLLTCLYFQQDGVTAARLEMGSEILMIRARLLSDKIFVPDRSNKASHNASSSLNTAVPIVLRCTSIILPIRGSDVFTSGAVPFVVARSHSLFSR